ncbi:hypothetical protein BZA05DRAFT_188192 [Tricharina praecox]|uniref:uncharacterized protein n=1 Tax=Tricharina praecox TaxID=43433 RepID=UPI00222097D5|nr:uncharacterized protein BZA05DRAFT_188192 [Tricharina praecox]KAI5842804.1 hypothetical protein BZA05DRAFT_188192 [Tricharina praecox]
MPRWWDSLCRYTHRLLRRVLRKDRHAEAQAAKPDLPDVPLEQSDVDHGALGTVAAPASASVEQQSNPQPAAQDIGSAVSVSGWSTVTDSPPATAGAVPADTTPAPGNPPQSSGATASAASPPFPNASFAPLTVPHCSPNTPPRPEFASFTVPYLCTSQPYDHLDFWTFPLRHGWNVHLADMVCHVLCPPGRRCQQQAEQEGEEERSPQPPIFSRVDGKPVRAEDKVAFLQAWLFFGVLDEVSRLCGLVIDVDAEFVAEAGDEVSTAGLNGLSSRWFEATKRTGRAGDKALMESVMKVARHARLMLTEEIVDEERTKRFEYTFAEGRILQSLDIVVRLVGLHLRSHVNIRGFTAMEEEGWGRQRIRKCLQPMDYSEGLDQFSDLAEDAMREAGWCESEFDSMTPEDVLVASLLDRPRIRDHSGCGEIVCSAYQTDEATYHTRHTDDDCRCEVTEVPTTLLVQALAAGRVPKVFITDQLELEVIASDDHPYIALSHGPMGSETLSSTRSPSASSGACADMSTSYTRSTMPAGERTAGQSECG